MAEQELREKIARVVYFDCTDCPYKYEGDCVSPDTCKFTKDKADQILALIKQANYVRLADDQSLPENPYSPPLNKTQEVWSDVVVATHRAMLNKDFRKVEL